ncbi:hypothetical protein FB451DRAFT_1284644 [Mycena latifolia]|nr:hypothetical protein FB451DRAFT_1284644 [Mycena latifolia]
MGPSVGNSGLGLWLESWFLLSQLRFLGLAVTALTGSNCWMTPDVRRPAVGRRRPLCAGEMEGIIAQRGRPVCDKSSISRLRPASQ